MQFSFRDSLGHNLHRIGQLAREETSKALGPFQMTPEQWQLLVVLAQHGSLTPTELGSKTLRDKTTISRILPGLLKKGWVETAENANDARSYVIKVKATILPMVKETMEAVRDHFGQNVFSCLSASEQEQLLTLILKLRTHLGD